MIRRIFRNYGRNLILGIIIGTAFGILLIDATLSSNEISRLKTNINSLNDTIVNQTNIIQTQSSTLLEYENQISVLKSDLTDANSNIEALKIKLNNHKTEQRKNEVQVLAATTSNIAVPNDGSQLNIYTNLLTDNPASIEDIDRVIDYNIDVNGAYNAFKNKGYVFYKAWEETGLDPMYVLSHAGTESGWGQYHFGERHNYFGIGAFDSNPNNASKMGNSLEEGIINGAKWIRKNYYDKGNVSLAMMANAGYASADLWPTTIAGIANQCHYVKNTNQ